MNACLGRRVTPRKRLPSVLAGAVAMTALALLAAACGQGEEEVVSDVTLAPTATGAATTPAVVTPTATPTTAPPPASPAPGWLAHSQPPSTKSEKFSLHYPAAWFATGGDTDSPGVGLTITLQSWQEGKPPARLTLPDGAAKVDIYVDPLDSPSCTVKENASPANLGNLPASVVTITLGEDSDFPGTTVPRVVADHGGFRYCLTGYFTPGSDLTIFQRIVDSFTVGS